MLSGYLLEQTAIGISPNSDSITLSRRRRKALLESEMPYSGLSDSRIAVCGLMTTSSVSLLGGIRIEPDFPVVKVNGNGLQLEVTQYICSGWGQDEHVCQVLPD